MNLMPPSTARFLSPGLIATPGIIGIFALGLIWVRPGAGWSAWSPALLAVLGMIPCAAAGVIVASFLRKKSNQNNGLVVAMLIDSAFLVAVGATCLLPSKAQRGPFSSLTGLLTRLHPPHLPQQFHLPLMNRFIVQSVHDPSHKRIARPAAGWSGVELLIGQRAEQREDSFALGSQEIGNFVARRPIGLLGRISPFHSKA